MKTEFFQLTTSRGDRLYGNMFYVRLVIFNSRPLVEIDCDEAVLNYAEIFSTHDLSWRSTT